jgi:AraC-like DNA-binding protein
MRSPDDFTPPRAPPMPRALHALQPTTVLVPPTRESAMVSMRQPTVLLLREGRAAIHRRSGRVDRFDVGCVTFYPPDADADGDRWSTFSDARYTKVEFSPELCRTWLQRDAGLGAGTTRPVHLGDARMTWWVDEIERHCAHGEPFGELYTEGLSFALVSYLDGRLRLVESASSRAAPLSRLALDAVAGYIDAHLDSPLRVADLAMQCGVSPAHFARTFRAAFGVPVHHYVLARRVSRARALLRGDGASLAEIALACGFGSQAHFNAAFRRATGATPGRFRQHPVE